MHQPLEELKQLLSDKKLHYQIGVIVSLEMSPTRRALRALIALQPDDHQIVARVTFGIIDNESGVLMLPAIKDLVMVGLVDGDEEQAYVISRCSSLEELIAKDALDGSLVLKAREGKAARLLSDTKILLQKAKFGADPSADATAPLVLGDVLQNFMDQLISAITSAPQLGVCGVGPVYLDPGLATQLNNLKQTFVDTAATNFNSQIAFTERGAP